MYYLRLLYFYVHLRFMTTKYIMKDKIIGLGLLISLIGCSTPLKEVASVDYTEIDLNHIPSEVSLTGTNPEKIALDAFGIKEPVEGNFQEEVSVDTTDPEKAIATLIQRNLGDDSVRSIKYRMEFKPDGERQWRLVWIGTQQICWPERGHQEWSAESCI